MAQTATEKVQPWKEQWLARTKNTSEVKREGTKHGFAKGQEIVLDGTSCMNAVLPPRDK